MTLLAAGGHWQFLVVRSPGRCFEIPSSNKLTLQGGNHREMVQGREVKWSEPSKDERTATDR